VSRWVGRKRQFSCGAHGQKRQRLTSGGGTGLRCAGCHANVPRGTFYEKLIESDIATLHELKVVEPLAAVLNGALQSPRKKLDKRIAHSFN